MKKTLRYEVGTYNFACEIMERLSVPVDHTEVSGMRMRYRFYNANKENVAEYNERKGILYVFSDYKLPHSSLAGKGDEISGMNVGYMKQLIEDLGLPDDMEVFVACQGYCNYDFKVNKPYKNTDTFAIIHDGKLFITDECAVDDGKGGTI